MFPKTAHTLSQPPPFQFHHESGAAMAEAASELLRAYRYRLSVVSGILEALIDTPFHIAFNTIRVSPQNTEDEKDEKDEKESVSRRCVDTIQRDVFRWLMCADPVAVAAELAAGVLFECLEAWCASYHQAVSGYYLPSASATPSQRP